MTDIKMPPMPQTIENRLSDFAVACAFGQHELRASAARELRQAIEEHARETARLNAQAVPDEWKLVPVEPTPEMLAAGAVSVLPQASNDIELARSAAMIVLCKPDAPSGVPMELLAATIATMAPYYRAMLSAAPAAPQPAQQWVKAPEIWPISPDVSADLERSDWTPDEALRWYAAGKHYDTVPNGDGTSSTRILDNGAVASNALKSLSREYAEYKGDVALQEIAPQPAQSLTDEQCDAIYTALDTWARKADAYEFGLPRAYGGGAKGGREIIRNAISGVKND